MNNIVGEYLKKHLIYSRKIVVALSGGPDSVALLYLLNHLKSEFSLDIEAAYINHGIRSEKENFSDYNLNKLHTKKLGIKLHTKNFSFGYLENKSAREGRSLEAVAREARYDFFKTLLNEKDLLATGHNRDDQIETQIMRFFQGTTLKGLEGIKERFYYIIRPLYSVPKRDILRFLESNGIRYNTDYTNNECDYLRNRVRNKLIPLVSDIFPGFYDSLKRVETEIKSVNNFFDNHFSELIWINAGDTFNTDFEKFNSLPNFKKKDEIFKIYDRVYKGVVKDFRLPGRFLKPLEEIKGDGILLDGHGYQLIKNKKNLYFKPIKNEKHFNIFVNKLGIYTNTLYNFNINIESGEYFPGLTLPFTLRGINRGGGDLKKIKKKGINPLEYDNIIIIEKDFKIFGLINSNCKECIDIKVVTNEDFSSNSINNTNN